MTSINVVPFEERSGMIYCFRMIRRRYLLVEGAGDLMRQAFIGQPTFTSPRREASLFILAPALCWGHFLWRARRHGAATGEYRDCTAAGAAPTPARAINGCYNDHPILGRIH